MPKVALICEVCGGTFERWPAFIRAAEERGSKVRFCSKACQTAGRAAGLFQGRQKTGRFIECEQCRQSFWVRPYQKHRRFCTEACRLAAYKAGVPRADRVRGDWKINQPPNRFSWRHRRDWLGTECARCGSTENLQIDHIVSIIAGGKAVRENAQTLCLDCNTKKRMQHDIPMARQQNLVRRLGKSTS